MSLSDCRGYTLYTAKCSECDYKESVNSIQMRCCGAKLSVEDGDDCPEVDDKGVKCCGTIIVTEREASAEEHKEGYLSYHADDEHDRGR